MFLARSNARLGRELILQAREQRRALAEQDEFTLGALQIFQRDLLHSRRELDAMGVVRERGLMPYLEDPRSRMREEIRAVMEEFSVSQQDAMRWILSRAADLRTGDDGATRANNDQG